MIDEIREAIVKKYGFFEFRKCAEEAYDAGYQEGLKAAQSKPRPRPGAYEPHSSDSCDDPSCSHY